MGTNLDINVQSGHSPDLGPVVRIEIDDQVFYLSSRGAEELGSQLLQAAAISRFDSACHDQLGTDAARSLIDGLSLRVEERRSRE